LQLLGILGLHNPETLCVFRKYHYECYVKNVVLSDYIRPQIEEAALALSKGEGSEQLGQFLEKIKEIKQGLSFKQISYQDFIAGYKSQYNFNDHVTFITAMYNIGPEAGTSPEGDAASGPSPESKKGSPDCLCGVAVADDVAADAEPALAQRGLRDIVIHGKQLQAAAEGARRSAV